MAFFGAPERRALEKELYSNFRKLPLDVCHDASSESSHRGDPNEGPLHKFHRKPENISLNYRPVLVSTGPQCIRIIESMMGLRPRQENLRLVFRLFSLII